MTTRQTTPTPTPETYPDPAGVTRFTSREIDTLVALTREWAGGHFRPSSETRCHITRRVRDWALAWGLLTSERHHGRDRLAYPSSEHPARAPIFGYVLHFSPVHDLPTEALWRAVRPMLRRDGTRGYTISTQPQWLHLNITPRGHRFFCDREEEEMLAVLSRLSAWHYINFQMAGTVWSITLDERTRATWRPEDSAEPVEVLETVEEDAPR